MCKVKLEKYKLYVINIFNIWWYMCKCFVCGGGMRAKEGSKAPHWREMSGWL
jgi:hypothetical protein